MAVGEGEGEIGTDGWVDGWVGGWVSVVRKRDVSSDATRGGG